MQPFNIAWGCVKVSPGCHFCYAEEVSRTRDQLHVWGKDAPRRTLSDKYWQQPHNWNRKAKAAGERKRVFCSSMCDIFEDHPTIEQERERLWQLIRETPHLDWQLLTKRIERVAGHLPDDWGHGYHNVWLGTSIENAEYAFRANILNAIPATVRFVSYEPALGPLADALDLEALEIDWVIVGGESGPHFRPMDVRWARSMRLACELAGVAFFYKQSAARRTEMGIELDGEIVRNYPMPRLPHPTAFTGKLF